MTLHDFDIYKFNAEHNNFVHLTFKFGPFSGRLRQIIAYLPLEFRSGDLL